jgi:cold shock CspA family protein
MQGTITHLDVTKNFGFIRPDEPVDGRDKDVFFHRSQSPEWGTLSNGDAVEYDLAVSRKDPRDTVGANVRLRGDPGAPYLN